VIIPAAIMSLIFIYDCAIFFIIVYAKMPVYCKLNDRNECQLDREIPFIGALLASDTPNHVSLQNNFIEACGKSTIESCSTTDDTMNFCTWSESENICNMVSLLDMGLPLQDDGPDFDIHRNACKQITTKAECNKRVCPSTDILNEFGECIPRPWYDWKSCEEEVRQQACPGMANPNPMVYNVCPYTCTLQQLYIPDAPDSKTVATVTAPVTAPTA
jgi:hypothetical protein